VRGTGDATSDEQPSRRAVKMRRKKAEATEMRKATCIGPRRMVLVPMRVLGVNALIRGYSTGKKTPGGAGTVQ
jgi:hypothetical protein